ncbi:hypothetical protein TCAL_14939 [Tigriopus californicus]|uniref:Ubiquitin-like-conjugating enzyme ATG10 n=1 Tax=Tigriopus californicus TaxID=6832 RepID=A0A553N7A4_TIGCA|nr:hypothetical protein TCAL_14939 [Tigriopus californicus]
MLMSYEEFMTEAEAFVASNSNWHVQAFDASGLICGLRRTSLLKNVNLDLHLLYSPSYQSPVLMFKPAYLSGQPLSSSEIQDLFSLKEETFHALMTQELHPMLNLPYWTVHTCNVSEICQAPGTESRPPGQFITMWLSIFMNILCLPPSQLM